MSTCSAYRRPLPTATMLEDALAAAEQTLDGGSTAAPLLLSLRRGRRRRGVELSVLPLVAGTHPVEVLGGFTAPPSWEAVGCVAAASAYPVHPAPEHAAVRRRVRFGFLLHRDGTSVASVTGHSPQPGHEGRQPPEGRIADTCRRVLNLATPPAAQGPEAWWAMVWLDRIFAEAVLDPAHRPSWPEVLALHPLFGAGDASGPAAGHRSVTPPGPAFATSIAEVASTLTWGTIRSAVACGPDAVNQVDPDLAAWLDDGSFARAVIEPYVPVPVLLHELTELLSDHAHAEVTAAVREWGLA